MLKRVVVAAVVVIAVLSTVFLVVAFKEPQGCTVDNFYQNDPSYIEWDQTLFRNTGNFRFRYSDTAGAFQVTPDYPNEATAQDSLSGFLADGQITKQQHKCALEQMGK